jgi:hypothetical protein
LQTTHFLRTYLHACKVGNQDDKLFDCAHKGLSPFCQE